MIGKSTLVYEIRGFYGGITVIFIKHFKKIALKNRGIFIRKGRRVDFVAIEIFFGLWYNLYYITVFKRQFFCLSEVENGEN